MTFLPSLAVLTVNARMRAVLDDATTVAASDGTVLLVGETGVGKELFADYIHRVSERSERPLVKIALSAIPPELLESELFGHERGAFTHAVNERKGIFELAEGGTLFLDDIDDVPLAIQAKLLRVLESREVKRVGGTRTLPVDVRLISASKVDLVDLSRRGLFRSDLLYRLHVFPIEIPPLRERPEDVGLLFEHFLKRYAPGREIRVAPEVSGALERHPWPGNVRELRNLAQRVALFVNGEVRLAELPAEYRGRKPIEQLIQACSRCMVEESMDFNEVVACLERHLLEQALHAAEGNQTQAARALGLHLSTLRDKLRKHQISEESQQLGQAPA